jgi:hypothetical protein
MFPATGPRRTFPTVRPLNQHRTAALIRSARPASQRQLVEQSLLRCPSEGPRDRT